MTVIFFFVDSTSRVARRSEPAISVLTRITRESLAYNCHGLDDTGLAVRRFTCAEEPPQKMEELAKVQTG